MDCFEEIHNTFMMENCKKLHDTLLMARREYDNALERRGGIARTKERLLNILFSDFQTIMWALDNAESGNEELEKLKAENEMLHNALDDADAELIKLRHMNAGDAPPTKKKAKAEAT